MVGCFQSWVVLDSAGTSAKGPRRCVNTSEAVDDPLPGTGGIDVQDSSLPCRLRAPDRSPAMLRFPSHAATVPTTPRSGRGHALTGPWE